MSVPDVGGINSGKQKEPAVLMVEPYSQNSGDDTLGSKKKDKGYITALIFRKLYSLNNIILVYIINQSTYNTTSIIECTILIAMSPKMNPE